MTSYFNIHDKIGFSIEGNKGMVNSIDKEFFYFKSPEIETDIDISVAPFKVDKKNMKLSGKVYSSDRQIYVEDVYKLVKWKVLFDWTGEKFKIKFNGTLFSNFFLKLYMIQGLIRYIAPDKGLTPFHSSAVAKDSKGYMFAAFKGTGKTSTMMNTLYDGYSFMADDLSFVSKDGFLLSFPTLIHLYSYNLKQFPRVRKDLTFKKKAEFFVKSLVFKGTLGNISFPTALNPYIISKEIPKKVKLEHIINLIKEEKRDMIDFLVDTNMYEMFRLTEYMKEYDASQSATLVEDYKKRLRKSYKALQKYMKTVEVPSGYNPDIYSKIMEIIK